MLMTMMLMTTILYPSVLGNKSCSRAVVYGYHTFQECGQLGEQCVEAPVFSKMGCTNSINWLRSENILPWMFNMRFLRGTETLLNVA